MDEYALAFICVVSSPVRRAHFLPKAPYEMYNGSQFQNSEPKQVRGLEKQSFDLKKVTSVIR